jgi:hypothetical protein
MASIQTRDGRPVVNGSGQPYVCDDCPCGGGFETCLDRFPGDNITVTADSGVLLGTVSSPFFCSDCATISVGDFVCDLISANSYVGGCDVSFRFTVLTCGGDARLRIDATLFYDDVLDEYQVQISWRFEFIAGGNVFVVSYVLSAIPAATFEAGGNINIPYLSNSATPGSCSATMFASSVVLTLP